MTKNCSVSTIVGNGYNGGSTTACQGQNTSTCLWSSGGGGATHIATVPGLLKDLSSYKNTASENISNEIIIVAGGGGAATGSEYYYSNSSNTASCANGGSAGGMRGVDGNPPLRSGYANMVGGGGTQNAGGTTNNTVLSLSTFGQACIPNATYNSGGLGVGGGSGWYGGGCGQHAGGGGGSSYIANPNLKNKSMYCYNCAEDLTNASTFTVRTNGTSSYRDTTNCPNGYSSDPISKCAKAGNGYAKITYLGEGNITTLYSAAVDEVYYYDSSNTKRVVGTTDNTGKLENAFIPYGVTLYSSIAKDSTDLSNPYNKTFNTIDSETYLMPGDSSTIMYWYGYGSNNLTIYKDSNAGTVAKTTNNVTINHYVGSAYNAVLVYPSTMKDLTNYNNIKMTIRFTDSASYVQHFGITNSAPNLSGWTFNGGYIDLSTSTLSQVATFDISAKTGSYYFGYETNAYPQVTYIDALWLE